MPTRPMAHSPGGGDERNSSAHQLPAKARSSSPMATMRYWNLWLRPPPRLQEHGQRRGTKRTRHADRKSCKLTTQVIRLRSTSKTPIERIRFNEKVLVYIFSNRTQRAMSITSSWILSTRNTHYTIKNSTEKLLYIVIQILIPTQNSKFTQVPAVSPTYLQYFPDYAAFVPLVLPAYESVAYIGF